jgi:energy-converting hydrogenase Eha subunit A
MGVVMVMYLIGYLVAWATIVYYVVQLAKKLTKDKHDKDE